MSKFVGIFWNEPDPCRPDSDQQLQDEIRKGTEKYQDLFLELQIFN